jgi:hypothetical protein
LKLLSIEAMPLVVGRALKGKHGRFSRRRRGDRVTTEKGE